MNPGRFFRLTATACLVLSAPVAFAAVPQGMVVQTHLKYAGRASLAEPALRSSAALVLDTTHDSVLYSRRSGIAMPIASISKLMTALVVMDAGLPLDEDVTLTAEDRSSGGKRIISRLAPGAHLTRGDLMHLALMASDNRAAHALGRNYPGGVAALRRGHERQGARARHDQRALRRAHRACRTRTSPAPRTCRSW